MESSAEAKEREVMSTDNMKTCRELYERYDRLVDALIDGIAPVYTLDELRDIASDLERVPASPFAGSTLSMMRIKRGSRAPLTRM